MTGEPLSTNQEVYQLKVCIDGICRDGTLHTCIPKGPLWIKRSVFTCCQAGYEPKHNACSALRVFEEKTWHRQEPCRFRLEAMRFGPIG